MNLFSIENLNLLNDFSGEGGGALFSILKRASSEEIVASYGHYCDQLILLNTDGLAEKLLQDEICLDSVEFLNFRAASIFGGGGVIDHYLKSGEIPSNIIEAAHQPHLAHSLDANVRQLLSLAYWSQTRLSLTGSGVDQVSGFVRQIFSKPFSLRDSGMPYRYREELEEVGRNGFFVSSVRVANLGLVEVGQFILHKKYGPCYICWLRQANEFYAGVLHKNGYGQFAITDNDNNNFSYLNSLLY